MAVEAVAASSQSCLLSHAWALHHKLVPAGLHPHGCCSLQPLSGCRTLAWSLYKNYHSSQRCTKAVWFRVAAAAKRSTSRDTNCPVS